jgi:hypothetical protein
MARKKEKIFRLYKTTNTRGEWIRPKKIGDYDHPEPAETEAWVWVDHHSNMEFKIVDCWTGEEWEVFRDHFPGFPKQIDDKPWEWKEK